MRGDGRGDLLGPGGCADQDGVHVAGRVPALVEPKLQPADTIPPLDVGGRPSSS